MIIIDYNAIAFGCLHQTQDDDLLGHMILNTIRMYNVKYRKEYGQIVIACDDYSWRKKAFPNYKAKRKASREKSGKDWDKIFGIINGLTEDFSNHFPYKVVKVAGAEADDVIGALVKNTQEFGNYEPVMIISGDKDFIQLHQYDNVKQYSPITKKLIKHDDPLGYILEHCFKGDSGDGVPNVLSPDNVFVDGIRQSPVSKKKIDYWMENIDDLQSVMDEDTYRNFIRNRLMVNLDYMPEDIRLNIIDTYESCKPAPKMKVLNYLIKNRHKRLIECAGEFY